VTRSGRKRHEPEPGGRLDQATVDPGARHGLLRRIQRVEAILLGELQPAFGAERRPPWRRSPTQGGPAA
jgi:hypothetical protein